MLILVTSQVLVLCDGQGRESRKEKKMRLNAYRLFALGFITLAGVSFGVAASNHIDTVERVEKASVYNIHSTYANRQNINIEGKIVAYLGNGTYKFADLDGKTISLNLDDSFDWSQVQKDELISLNAVVVKDFITPKLLGKSAVAI